MHPDHAVLGEEDGLDGPEDAPTWVIDPIDGTSNFVKGNPIFATLIGLRVDGVEMLGVASAPALGTRLDGVVGVGASQDARPIRVSTSTVSRTPRSPSVAWPTSPSVGSATCSSGRPTTTGRQRAYGDFWGHCLVAAGSTDIAVEAAVSTWDLVAVKAIVEAAGGRFTDLDGVATADGGSAVSTNGRLHDAALALVHG